MKSDKKISEVSQTNILGTYTSSDNSKALLISLFLFGIPYIIKFTLYVLGDDSAFEREPVNYHMHKYFGVISIICLINCFFKSFIIIIILGVLMFTGIIINLFFMIELNLW